MINSKSDFFAILLKNFLHIGNILGPVNFKLMKSNGIMIGHISIVVVWVPVLNLIKFSFNHLKLNQLNFLSVKIIFQLHNYIENWFYLNNDVNKTITKNGN